jgi:hypothetical protein
MTFSYLLHIHEDTDWGARNVLVCGFVRARVLLVSEPFFTHCQPFQSVHIWAGRSLMIPSGYHAAYVDTYIKRIES